jgi:hypothetical protein
MTIGMSEIFDGVANAAQPLASVYIGEGNPLLARRIMRSALATALAEGIGAMLLLLAFPGLMLLLAGIDNPGTASEARVAVRLVSMSLPGLALVLLFNSHYVFIGKGWLAATLTVLAVLFAPLALLPAFGAAWGPRGAWAALGVAPCLAVVLVAILVLALGGIRRFPFLLPTGREDALRVFDLELAPDAICEASAAVGAHLRRKGIGESRAAKAALLVEEALMVVRDRNSGRRTMGEVTVDLNDGLALVLRDDGEIFDITDADARVASLRSYLVANLMTALPSRRNLTATGFNRNVFKL